MTHATNIATWSSGRAAARPLPGLPGPALRDALGFLLEVVVPTLAKGVIIRRPRMVAAAEWLGLDDRAVRRMQHLRDAYGPGPLLLRLPVRPQAILLAPDHVHRVLRESPEPFATASSEKRAALSHFEPRNALISHGPARAERRRFNEDVLDHGREVHRLAGTLVRVAQEESAAMLAAARRHGTLTWTAFADAWFRLVRRVVFGDGAAHDHELSAMTAALRSDANWAFLKPRRHHLRRRFFARLRSHLRRAEADSLASLAAAAPVTDRAAPSHQVPQWLFAFDPAGMTTFRALALLAAHPAAADRARREAQTSSDRQHLPFLRATVLESLRLWPTTPLVLRQTTRETVWEHGVMPANTGVLIYAPLFHRDDARLPYAHTFAPELWSTERTEADWPLIPFSGGPAICPARHLVQMLSSAVLASLIEERAVRLVPPDRLDPARLPGTLDNYSLRFVLEE